VWSGIAFLPFAFLILPFRTSALAHSLVLINFGEPLMDNLLKYLSTAPVLAAVWMVITAGILIEFNRFFPDLLLHP
jgi:photosystem I subunit 9